MLLIIFFKKKVLSSKTKDFSVSQRGLEAWTNGLKSRITRLLTTIITVC